MVCQAPSYTGGDQPNYQWSNWNGEVENTIRLLTPSTLAELVRVVAEATDAGSEVHALGSGWAFEDLATSADRVINLAGVDPDTSPLPDVVGQGLTDEWRARQDDPNGHDRLAHVYAGLEIGAVNAMLDAQGLAMRTLGGANGQSLAGAFSTSTHGGDIHQAPICDQIKALHLVTVGGQELWIEPASEPITTDDRLRPILECADTKIVRDDDLFHAALVAAGRFGVIYSVVVHVRPAFKLAEWTTRQPRASVLAALSAGIDASTGLANLEAVLPAPRVYLQANLSTGPLFLQLLFNSQNPSLCLVTRRWPTTGQDLSPIVPPSGLCSRQGAQLIMTGTAQALRIAAAQLALIPIVGVVLSLLALADADALDARAADPTLTTGEATAICVNLA
jgi:hypothetical protein